MSVYDRMPEIYRQFESSLALMFAGGSTFEQRLARMLHQAPKDEAKPWYRIENKASSGETKTAEILIYDEIDPWFGVSAGDFANDLNALEADEIVVGINSPGGIVFDGIAIMNALKRHPARIVTRIDGLAASAASFIAMAGDEIQTSKYAEMMIHEARGVVMGTADDFKEMRDLLIRHNESIASVYADRAGGDVKDWLKLMHNETWFTADEMVSAGLADRVIEADDESSAADKAESLKNRFDLSVFNYAGRRSAPAPKVRNCRSDRTKGTAKMPTIKEHLADKYGLDPEMNDDDFAAAVDEKLAELAAPPAAEPPAADAGAEPTLAAAAAVLKKSGFAMVDSATLEELRAQSKQGSEAFAAIQAEADARMVEDAIRAGKIRPADREKWTKNLGLDREAFTVALNSLEAVFPVQEAGHSMNPDPGASMKAPDDLGWFDTAPTEPATN